MALEFQGAGPNDGSIASLDVRVTQLQANGQLTPQQATGLTSPRLTQIPYIASGFTLPSSGALTNTIGSGDATINGVRIIIAATAVTFPASQDNYIDLTQAGAYVVVSVANGATVGMTQTPNSLRIGKVVTGASTITSATTGAKDPLGNWMGNLTPASYCYIATGSVATGPYVAGTVMTATTTASEVYDNDNMHSTTTNSNRITINKPGLYQLGASVFNSSALKNTLIQLNKNGITSGDVISNAQVQMDTGTNAYIFTQSVNLPPIPLVAGDWISCFIKSTDAAASAAGGVLYAIRVG
jgi:hypothetical protein